MKAIILAGGKGTRLKPYTTVFPKPLMPVGDKPILEIILKQLKNNGFKEIILSVGHLSELIQSFFNNGKKYGLKIRYVKEDKPLGTAGPLALIRNELKDTFLVMNGDILTDLDYKELLEYHKKEKAQATIAIKRRTVDIDFGLPKINEKNDIVGYDEKPSIEHYVSMGIYILEPDLLEYIKDGVKLDFPDLVRILAKNKKKVKAYVYDGYWLDIGRPEDYEKANQDSDEIIRKILGENVA